MIATAWLAAGVAGTVAVAAGLADRARGRRRDLDRIGWIDWRTVQMAAMLALLVAVGLALAGCSGSAAVRQLLPA